jgi:hypothetical protein
MFEKFGDSNSDGCRLHSPDNPPLKCNTEQEDEVCIENFCDEGEEGPTRPKPELDPISDPLETCASSFPSPDWERRIYSIKVKNPRILSEEEQMFKIQSVLETLDSEG